MKIKVTEKHIDSAKQILSSSTGYSSDFRSANCPVALAIKEQFGMDDVRVERTAIFINRFRYICPEVVKEFVYLFDNRLWPYPIEFELERAPSPFG